MRKVVFVIAAAMIACTIPTPESSAYVGSQKVSIKVDTANSLKQVVEKTTEVNKLLKQLNDIK